jgi:RNA polymerase sigma-70 factor (ECF subfamily)
VGEHGKPATGGIIVEASVTGKAKAEGRDAILAAEGDSRAFERLYRDHVGRVHSLALRMAGPEWAEDLTQEIFVRAWSKLDTFRGDSAFGTWLHRLAVNLILSRRETLRKRAQRTVQGAGLLERMASRSPSPGLTVDFEAGIQRVPEGARQVFVLYEIEGYSHQEIAEAMGISIGTSKSQLHRARMILRNYLN